MILENYKLEEIDKANKLCYDAIGSEYGNANHETCRDFDAGTICFLKKAINQSELKDFNDGFNYLDLGIGTGVSLDFLYSWLESKKANIDVLDISVKMLDFVKSKYEDKVSNYYHTSIHNFKPEKKYDLIVGSLCDPFLTPEALQIMKKSLSPEGVLLITIPSNNWAKKVRSANLQQTTFHDNKRNKHISYSFCWSKSDLIKYAEQNGLYITYARVILIDEIKKKKEISSINSNLILNEKRVPMLLSLIILNK